MPYITVNENLPGIRSLMAFRPETAAPLGQLAEILLHDENNTLTRAERELIATFVSYLNGCYYCHHSHGALAACYLDGDTELVDAVRKDYANAEISDKLKALLQIAGKVQQSGKAVRPEDIDHAREQGATDREIHDTVLIAAAFSLFNRYVDGLGTVAPTDLASYPIRARQVAELGYGPHIYATPQPVTP
ncbi:MAG TPA: peroxidase-related enzyme [Puia sp.]|nr:peroxidase-related enzyme [Puia sp.]